jgi:transcriptional regulator with XRE-family HTH domain
MLDWSSHQAQFARELFVSQGQISRYEQGRSEIGAEVLLWLAWKSGKTIEWRLNGKDSL